MARWGFTVAAGICSLGGTLVNTRFIPLLWVFYSAPGLLIPFVLYHEPLVACQVVGVTLLVLRLTMPRGVALLFGGVFVILLMVSFGLSGRVDIAPVFVSDFTNALVLFALIDGLLAVYHKDAAQRRLVLFEYMFPVLLGVLVVRLGLDVAFSGIEHVGVSRYGIPLGLIAIYLTRHYSPVNFHRLLVAALVAMALLPLLSAFVDTGYFGAGKGTTMAMFVVLSLRWQTRLSAVFVFGVLLMALKQGALGFYSTIWALFSLLSVWLLMRRTMILLAEKPQGIALPESLLLGLNSHEWTWMSGRFLVTLLAFLALIVSVGLTLASHSQLRDEINWQAGNQNALASMEKSFQSMLGNIVELQATAWSAYGATPRLNELERVFQVAPAIQRWRWVDANHEVQWDKQRRDVVGVSYADDWNLQRNLRLARYFGPGKSFISRLMVHEDSLALPAERASLYVVTPQYTEQGDYLGALVANVSLSTLFDGVQALKPTVLDANIRMMDRDGHFFYESGRGYLWQDYYFSDTSYALDDYETYLTMRNQQQGRLVMDGRELWFAKLTLGATTLPMSRVFVEQPFGFLIIEHGLDHTLLEYLLTKSWFWVLLVVLLGTTITISLWSAMAALRQRRLDEQLHVQQQLAIAAEQSAAQSLEAEKNKSLFLSNMSHEMRTPLNGLIGVGQILQKSFDKNMLPTLLGMLQESAERLDILVNDILDVGAIKRGELTLQIAPFDLQALLASIQHKQSLQAQQKGLALQCDFSGLARGHVLGDKHRLGQVIDNLLTNAIKFTDQGVITLRVGSINERIEISVQDTGIGMSPEVQRRIFSRFEQGDLSATKRYQGAGLGLSICRDLIAMMDGEIKVTSTQGVGSQFVVSVPLPSVDEISDTPATMGNAALRGRVLVVDDDATNVLVLAEVLKGWSLTVETAMDGQAALDVLAKVDVDLVLTDIAMPEMNGEQLLHKMRDLYPSIPCLAVTGNATGTDITHYQSVGFDAVFKKPLDYIELRQMLGRWLGPSSS